MPNGSSRVYVFRGPDGLGRDAWNKLKFFGGIIAVLLLLNLASMGTDRLIAGFFHYLVYVPVIVMSLTLHEFSHAAMANFLGDPTARLQGRMSLNPMRHLDPIGTLMLFFASFGWARPVPVDSSNFRVPARAMMSVSLAGPGANIALALLAGAFLKVMTPSFGPGGLPPLAQILCFRFGYFLLAVNIGLAVFNMIPLPPLDGSKVLAYFLPPRQRMVMRDLETTGPFLLMMLLAFGILDRLMGPVMGWAQQWIIQLYGLEALFLR